MISFVITFQMCILWRCGNLRSLTAIPGCASVISEGIPMKKRIPTALLIKAAFVLIASVSICLAQVDPGVRGGPPGAGGPVPGSR